MPNEKVVEFIHKPNTSSLDKFKSKRAAAVANVGTLAGPLPHYTISQAKDFVRLHSNEDDYWSPELCFVSVPIKGTTKDQLHLIDEELALKYVAGGQIQRFRLALASKPYDVFFLCHVPTQNTDNSWNMSNLQACEQARALWTKATSRKGENVEAYRLEFARDANAFPEPKWPTQTLEELITVTFSPDRMIDHERHPALLRLIGAKQDIS